MARACRGKQQVNNAKQATKKPRKDKGKDKAPDQSLNVLELEEINLYNDEIYHEEDISEEPDPWDKWDDIGT